MKAAVDEVEEHRAAMRAAADLRPRQGSKFIVGDAHRAQRLQTAQGDGKPGRPAAGISGRLTSLEARRRDVCVRRT